jgi:RimJ/RimL family protein N-acetyltransferase
VLSLPLGDGAELRPLEPWQAVEFAAHIDRIREHLSPWVPLAHSVTDVESARAVLQRYADKQAADEGRLYGLHLDGELVGGTLFRVFDVEWGTCEVGVWIAPEAQGRGLITRAVRLMLDWAFDVRGMSRVEWRNDTDNERSKAVARRLGMSLDGVLRSSFLLNGERRDTEVWAVLADEWRAIRADRAERPEAARPARSRS